MSSILDALSKLDPEHPTRNTTLPLPPPQRPRRRGPLAGVLVALACVVAVGGWWLHGATPPAQEAVSPVVAETPTPTATPTPAPPPALATGTTAAPANPGVATPATSPPAPPTVHHGLPVVAAVPPPATTAGERPWIRTDAPPPAPIQPVRAVDPTPPPAAVNVAPIAPPVMPPVPAPPARGVFVAPKPDAMPAADAVPLPPSSTTPTLAGVRISFLAYSRIPDLRTVSLAVDGDRLVTLREGEKSGDLEIVHIHADRVEVKRNGEMFTVPARN